MDHKSVAIKPKTPAPAAVANKTAVKKTVSLQIPANMKKMMSSPLATSAIAGALIIVLLVILIARLKKKKKALRPAEAVTPAGDSKAPISLLKIPPAPATVKKPFKLRKLFSPKIVFGVVIIAAIISAALLQGRIKEQLFKKPSLKAKKGAMKEEAAPPQEPIMVKVYKVQKKDFEDTLPLLGTVKGAKEINLRFEVNGILDSFNFKEGERVEGGEIMATLNQKDALLKMKYNQIELEKHQKLYDIGAIVKSKLDQVKLELDSAKRELDKTYLYAPISGVLGAKDAEVGEFVTSNDRVATLIDDKDVIVEVGVVEKDIGKIKVGQSSKVSVDTYPDTEFSGVVDNVSPVVEGKSRTQTAKVKVKNNKSKLVPGMFARVSCAVYKVAGGIVIPNSALDKTDEGYVTYVVKKVEAPPKKELPAAEKAAKKKPAMGKAAKKNEKEAPPEETQEVKEEEGVVQARPVKADYRSSDFYVVKEGVSEGDIIVVETQEKLKDGAKVIITETQEAIF